jgi:outer membrane immunogenic protein
MPRWVIVGAGLLSIAGFGGAASGADLPARTYTKAPAIGATMYDWSGFYLGLNGGGGFSHNCWTGGGAADLGCHDATGGLAGGQIGYRWQAANWVFGLEAQGDWANLKGSNTGAIGTFGGLPFANQTRVDGVGLFTGQVGYAWNNLLWYAKGGAAVTHDRYNGVALFAVGPFPVGYAFDQSIETRWGGVVGTGIEVGLASGWSVALEYDHLFMGSSRTIFIQPSGIPLRANTVRQDVDMGTVRVNYRFGPVAAKY